MVDDTRKVNENSDVNGKEGDADFRDAVQQLADLPGQERRGDDEGEIFAPDLFEIEADGFKDAEAGVTEGGEADAAQHGVVDELGLVKEEVDEAGLGVEAQVDDEGGNGIAYVLADEMQRSEADQRDDERAEELVSGDEQQADVVVSMAGFGGGSGHGLI